MFQLICNQPYTRLFVLLLVLVSTSGVRANSRVALNSTKPSIVLGTVSASSSSLSFITVENKPSEAKSIDFFFTGLSNNAQTIVTAPPFYQVFDKGIPANSITLNGGGAFQVFVRFAGGDPGTFKGDLTISGNEIPTKLIPLTTGVLSNPAFFPSNLNFTAIEGQAAIPQEITLTVTGLSLNTETSVIAPEFFQVRKALTDLGANVITFIGNGTFKAFVSSSTILDAKVISGFVKIENLEASNKVVPVKVTVLPKPTPVANPSSLAGFTAVQASTTSAAQSFDLSITGLPFQGAQNVTVTAPAGFSVSLSSNPATFINSFFLTPTNGKVNAKIFVGIKNNSPIGTVKGDLKITGNQIITKVLPLSGTITAKPLPALTVSKTSLTGFSTVTNKASLAQSYQLQATNLAANVSATVTAPTGYELSLTNNTSSVFSATKTIASSGGVINVNVFVRLKSQSATGSKSGNVVNTVAGITKNVSVSGTVSPQPAVTVNPISLSGFNTVKNQASANQTYTLTATNLAAGVTGTVTAPTNFEVRLQNSGSFVSTLTLTQTSTGTISRIVEVRLKATTTTGTVTGTIQNNVGGGIKNISLTGSVAAPSLSTTTSSLIFSTVKNKASIPKSYKVVATNLASGNTASISAPSGFEISLKTDGVFTNSLTLPQNVTNGISTDVFVRVKATATAGTLKGNITNSVAGLTKLIALTGTISATAALNKQAVIPVEELNNGRSAFWSVKTFPNPATDHLLLHFIASPDQIFQVQVLNAIGILMTSQEVKSIGGLQEAEVSLLQQPAGIYFLKVASGNQQKIVRFIKS